MHDIGIEVVGNLVNEVELRFTKAGEPVASFRVASTARRVDRSTGRWVDGDTHYFTVSCWRGLAHNVVQSLRKGEPVIVKGRLRSREVERPCGDHSHVVRYLDIDATTVGHDLTRGVSSFTRVKREGAIEAERRAVHDAASAAGVDTSDLVDLDTGEIGPVPGTAAPAA